MEVYVCITFALLTAQGAAYKRAPASAAVGRSAGLAARQRCTRANTSGGQSSGDLQRSGGGQSVGDEAAGVIGTSSTWKAMPAPGVGRWYQSCCSSPYLSPLAAALQLVPTRQLVQQPAQLVNIFRQSVAAESRS
jgi:hypothetical protein